MKEREEILEAIEKSQEVADELDKSNPTEAAAPYIILEALLWVVEADGSRDLLEELEEDVEELTNE